MSNIFFSVSRLFYERGVGGSWKRSYLKVMGTGHVVLLWKIFGFRGFFTDLL